jgi:hypothetical protein
VNHQTADCDLRGQSPYASEVLCHDLLEPELGVKLHAFATGRDKGIDLRHVIADMPGVAYFSSP